MTAREIDVILAGDPIEAIEAAKRLISADAIDASALTAVAVNKKNKTAARVAAIYALSFSDGDAIAAPAPADLVPDRHDDEERRAHHAEALAQIGRAHV